MLVNGWESIVAFDHPKTGECFVLWYKPEHKVYRCEKTVPRPLDGGYYQPSTALAQKGL